MTLYDFMTTPKAEQVVFVKQEGIHLASRIGEGSCGFDLYTVGSFYIEVLLVDGEMEIVRSFKTTTRLEPYLDCINLDGVLI